MTDTATLLALAERVEGLDGPDWTVDHDITAFIDPDLQGRWALAENEIVPINEAAGMAVRANSHTLPRYTASLDAAMTLVPEGWLLEMRKGQALYSVIAYRFVQLRREAFGATNANSFALALLAACLRALAQQQDRT